MAAGRPPTPTYLKIVKGTTRSHKRGGKPAGHEPTAPRSPLIPPEHLSPRALDAWGRIGPMLDRLGVLTTADEMALGELCNAFADVLEARASLARPVIADGTVIAEAGAVTYMTPTREGPMPRPRPELRLIAAASRRFEAMLGQFGLSPATRSKISLAGGTTTDPTDNYFT